jgi:uncharacterized protein (TIGR02391 family)
MRWDDLQLLALIDSLEESEPAYLNSGWALFQRATGNKNLPEEDQRSFVRELLLGAEAGLLEWIENQAAGHVRRPQPLHEANWWLQEIRDIRLTIAGRDRARGRVVLRQLPDPDEDDDRPITGMVLEEIARAIGDTYTGTQLPRFLRDAGIPDSSLLAEGVTGSKWEYVFAVLEELHDGGSATRRTLREFIGGWLSGIHHTPPDKDVQRRIVALLARQGWHVRDYRLVIGPRSDDALAALTPVGRDAQLAALHPELREVATRYLESGHLEVAIFEAFKAINNRVKTMTSLDLDGSQLMGRAFADTNAPLILADLSTETGRNIQAGFRFLFMGAVQGIRNPDAHEQFKELNDGEAFEMLAFASMLMRRLDEAATAASTP